jgi:hypothetical protein
VSARDERSDGDRAEARPGADRMGDLLPEVTLDESAAGWDDDETESDERLRREVPPHHG